MTAPLAEGVAGQAQFEPLIATCLAHLKETAVPLAWRVYPGTISIVLASGQKKVLNRSEMEELHDWRILCATEIALAAEAAAKAEAEAKLKAELAAAEKTEAALKAAAAKTDEAPTTEEEAPATAAPATKQSSKKAKK